MWCIPPAYAYKPHTPHTATSAYTYSAYTRWGCMWIRIQYSCVTRLYLHDTCNYRLKTSVCRLRVTGLRRLRRLDGCTLGASATFVGMLEHWALVMLVVRPPCGSPTSSRSCIVLHQQAPRVVWCMACRVAAVAAAARMIIHGRRCEHEGQLHVTRPGGLYLHVFTCIYMTCIYISYLRGSYNMCMMYVIVVVFQY